MLSARRCQFDVRIDVNWRLEMAEPLDSADFICLMSSSSRIFVPAESHVKFYIYIPLKLFPKLCECVLINSQNCGAFWSGIGLLIFW